LAFKVGVIEGKHVSDVSGSGADLAILNARYLGSAAFENLGHFIDALAGPLTQAAELDAEAAALDRGTWAGWHGDPPRAVVCLVTIVALASMCSCGTGSQSAVASSISNRHDTDERENYLSPEREEVRYGSSQVVTGSAAVRDLRRRTRRRSCGKDGPMHAALSFLGAAMLILAGVVVVLATVILILYEACWIVRLGHRLARGAAVDSAGRGGEGGSDEGGGA
jgi:hypothetical protein